MWDDDLPERGETRRRRRTAEVEGSKWRERHDIPFGPTNFVAWHRALEVLALILFGVLTCFDAFAYVLHLTTFNYSLTKVCEELAATAGS